jgi:hypothetical protein
MSGAECGILLQSQHRLADLNDALEVQGMQMQPGKMDPQPQDVLIVGVLLRLSRCGRELFECAASLSGKDQIDRCQGVGSVILESQIGVGSRLEPFFTDLERQPHRVAVFSGHPPNVDVLEQIGVEHGRAVVLAELRESRPVLDLILSVPADHE